MDDRPENLISTSLDRDGVLLATLDMPGRTMNVFSAGLMDALDLLMDRAERDPEVQSVVVTSGKPSFLAGADLVMVRGYTDRAKTASHKQMFEACGRLGRQFVRLERSAKPWVAAVNGLALGGGLELALACRKRVVAEDPKLQLGVPEVRWGLLPGAGGTQRLPRLAPFGDAMQMLLSGQSIGPAQAVALGVFEEEVPAAEVVEAAKALARQMHGKPYDPRTKFGRLDQPEVPAWSEGAGRALAARFGVDGERYDLYPAYAAICDAVLQGARLPLDQATAVEMNNFLRLMFSPVAGRMIRSLFLERLRAERELAPPEEVKIESLVHGPISDSRAAWRGALARLKLPQREERSMAADTVELVDHQGLKHGAALRVLEEAAHGQPLPQLMLAPAGPYGRVLEITGAAAADAPAFAAFAAHLWCLPWRTPGPAPVLQRLNGLALPQQAALAASCAAHPAAGDAAFLDVAACLAGVSPAWSGGPLAWSLSEGTHA